MCIIVLDTIGRAWVSECLPVLKVKGDESNIVPFHSHDLLFNGLYLFIWYNDIVLYQLVGKCLDCDLLTCLYCGYKNFHLVGSNNLFNIGI